MTRPLLLDTCAVMFAVDGTLAQSAIDAMDEAWRSGVPSFVSPITGWEVGILASRGRFKSPYPPLRWLEFVLALPNIRLSEMSPKVLLESSLLPGSPPRDPADRIIAATAREYGYVVVTRDAELRHYAKEGYLTAIAC